jgi:aspartate dehydrogenase
VRVAFVGWGAISRAAAELLHDDIKVVAVATRRPRSAAELPAGAQWLSSVDELAGTAPALVVEAAGRDAVVPWGLAALAAGADVAVSSVSAFADPEQLTVLRQAAINAGLRVHVHPGALAGVEALAAARLLGLDEVNHRIVKPPAAWQGTPAVDLCNLNEITEATEFFSGSAADTARLFPQNANVAMTTALAGVGPDRTQIRLVADPASTRNRHELSARGAFGVLDVTVANHPLPENPKTSALAALSLARLINGQVAGLSI